MGKILPVYWNQKTAATVQPFCPKHKPLVYICANSSAFVHRSANFLQGQISTGNCAVILPRCSAENEKGGS